MNYFHPLKILGKIFKAIKNISQHKGIEKIIKDLAEGEKKDYCVSAKDEMWEILLGKNNRIEIIFLFLNRDCKGILGISKLMNSTNIIKLLGKPTKSGEKQYVPILGEYGAW